MTFENWWESPEQSQYMAASEGAAAVAWQAGQKAALLEAEDIVSSAHCSTCAQETLHRMADNIDKEQ